MSLDNLRNCNKNVPGSDQVLSNTLKVTNWQHYIALKC